MKMILIVNYIYPKTNSMREDSKKYWIYFLDEDEPNDGDYIVEMAL